MVNKSSSDSLHLFQRLIVAYVVIAVGAVLALAVLAVVAPRLAPQEAWVHGLIVAVLSVVLLLRVQAARRGSSSALRAVGIICAVLVVADLVVACIPGFLPSWMRIESVAVAVLLATAVRFLVRTRLRNQNIASARAREVGADDDGR